MTRTNDYSCESRGAVAAPAQLRANAGCDACHSQPLLRLKDVATRLQVSIRTVQGWVASGRLPVLRISRRALRVTEEALAAFLEQAAEDGR